VEGGSAPSSEPYTDAEERLSNDPAYWLYLGIGTYQVAVRKDY
jgi:hypothetical protein